jgi:hypothetical protein
MNADDRVTTIAGRLREIAERLSAGDVSDEEAEGLAREAAELAAEGGAALEGRMRELATRDKAGGEL